MSDVKLTLREQLNERSAQLIEAERRCLALSVESEARHQSCLVLMRSVDQHRDRIRELDDLINNPHTKDFLEAVRLEAAHQRERWPADHDAGKTDSDWFWLIGYVAGKALSKPEKQLHHIITTAAVCLNWHMQRTVGNKMRPGIEEEVDGG